MNENNVTDPSKDFVEIIDKLHNYLTNNKLNDSELELCKEYLVLVFTSSNLCETLDIHTLTTELKRRGVGVSSRKMYR